MSAIYLPNNIDLNKYFEDLNNRGLQLEAHHIVKANLLEKIDKDLQISYAKVWDAVSQMNQFIEYGFGGTLKENRKQIFDTPERYFEEIKKTAKSDSIEEIDLIGVIQDAIKIDYKKEKKKNNTKESEEKVTSIVSFSEFLLHCLRIFKKDENISVDDKNLSDTFTEHISDINAKAFFELLFKLRILFDKCIIKSASTNDGIFWEIREIVKKNNDDEYEREKHFEGNIIQIQSMLYVSTSTSIWLTKVLTYLNCHTNISEEEFLLTLESIDKDVHPVITEVESLNKGTSTNRYRFYKLDYLLWKQWTNDKNNNEVPVINGIDNIRNKIKNFQFRDNRSVEHVQPQNPTMDTWVALPDKNLVAMKNEFGNLALISVSSNSSYNNQLPYLKKDDFIKRSKNWGIESLKLLDIYKYEEWNIESMNEHHDKMLKILGVDKNNQNLNP